MADSEPFSLIDRLADALENSRDTLVDFARGTANEYGSVGAALCIDKLLDEYREWRKTNPVTLDLNSPSHEVNYGIPGSGMKYGNAVKPTKNN